ncbi:competence protein ComK [Bacillus sp. V3B]|uniref:competence protein ComK n=1 Tax=Bacillus sp. V3B TaxID=2804915 RepID=UPI00210E2333|nr:competence protein ComK [Bacillus sp. V3B]MCQ6274685.1 competence protein ComK [Bacillus sp. V3B]
MKMLKTYLITPQTSALFSYFHNGYEYSQVLERKKTFLVSQSPEKIVKESFFYAGRDLNGATKSARRILKKRYKLPIALSPQKNIVLIKCKSTNQKGIVWIVSSHIDDIQCYENRQTIVHIIDGHSLTVDMKTHKLQTTRTEATFLRETLLERESFETEKKMTFLYEKDTGITLVQEEGHLNYTVKRKEEEDIEELELEK